MKFNNPDAIIRIRMEIEDHVDQARSASVSELGWTEGERAGLGWCVGVQITDALEGLFRDEHFLLEACDAVVDCIDGIRRRSASCCRPPSSRCRATIASSESDGRCRAERRLRFSLRSRSRSACARWTSRKASMTWPGGSTPRSWTWVISIPALYSSRMCCSSFCVLVSIATRPCASASWARMLPTTSRIELSAAARSDWLLLSPLTQQLTAAQMPKQQLGLIITHLLEFVQELLESSEEAKEETESPERNWVLLAPQVEAVAMVGGRLVIEASGGITLDTIAAIAETGVDYASSGALTHSAPAIDISFEIELL